MAVVALAVAVAVTAEAVRAAADVAALEEAEEKEEEEEEEEAANTVVRAQSANKGRHALKSKRAQKLKSSTAKVAVAGTEGAHKALPQSTA